MIGAISLMDSGPLPPELEEFSGHQGWHILPSGLPVLINNNVSEVPLKNSIWSQDSLRTPTSTNLRFSPRPSATLVVELVLKLMT